MKINLEQLKHSVTAPLPSICVITGDEELLIEETATYITKIAKQQDYHERIVLHATQHFNWQDLANEHTALSLFSAKKIIELHLPSGKPGKTGAEALIQFSAETTTDTLLLLRLPKLTSAQQNAKWFTSLEKNGLAIQIWPITREQLPQWLSRRLQRCNLSTDAEGLALLAELTEGNLLAAKQSIEKLSLLYGSGVLTVTQIQDCLSDNTHFDIYALLPSILQQDSLRSQKILQQLKASGAEPSLLLWLLHKDIVCLAELAHAKQAKQNLAPIFQKHGVWSNRQPLLKQHLQHATVQDYWQILQSLAQLDQILKGARVGNLWQDLQQLVMHMTTIGSKGLT